MDQNGFIVAVVSDPFEEDSSSQEGYLQSLNIYVNSVFMPGPCSEAVRYESRKEPIKVKKKEECPERSSVLACKSESPTYRIPQTSSSTRKTLVCISSQHSNLLGSSVLPVEAKVRIQR